MEGFLINTSCPTIELSFWLQNRLAAVSIVDCGQDSLSAVYTYFDPEFSDLSLGTYAIIRQFRWATRTNRTWLYLGMYVAQNRHLNYKGTFLPQQRFQQGNWQEILTAPQNTLE
jgi:arginine-tRNA-protein transferase